MAEVDVKKLNIDDLYRRLQKIDAAINANHKRTNAGSSLEQLQFYRNEVIQELQEKNYVANMPKPLVKNLTTDVLAKEEQENLKPNDTRPRK